MISIVAVQVEEYQLPTIDIATETAFSKATLEKRNTGFGNLLPQAPKKPRSHKLLYARYCEL